MENNKKLFLPFPRGLTLHLLFLLFLISLTACSSESLEDLARENASAGKLVRAYPDGKQPIPYLSPVVPYTIKNETYSFSRPDDPTRKLLYIDIFRPDAPGDFPTLMTATAYRREFMQFMPPDANELVSNGYAVVYLDCRGSGSAEGSWDSLSNEEIKDIVYVIEEWIPQQKWSNGKVGMFGISYMAIVQYLTAGYNPVHLKAIFPAASMADAYQDIFMHGGIFEQGWIVPWAMGTIFLSLLPSTEFFTDPLEAGVVFREHSEAYPDVIALTENTLDGSFFKERSPMYRWDQAAKLPVFETAGWWDIFTRGSLLNRTQLQKRQEQIENEGGTAGPKRFLIGPWYHVTHGDRIPLGNMVKRWFDWHLKLDDRSDYESFDLLNPEYPVTLYVYGEERWRREKAWPLDRAEYKTLYLSGTRQNNEKRTLNNGSLLWEERLEAGVDSLPSEAFTPIEYDPLQEKGKFSGIYARSSVRWIGGVTSFLGFDEDDSSNERVTLTFSTPPLDEDVEVTGPITLRLWAESVLGEPVDTPPDLWFSYARGFGIQEPPAGIFEWAKKPDVHWIVNLNDVDPKGRSRNLTSGWLAASHRPDPDRPDWTKPGYDPFNYPEHQNPQPPVQGEPREYVIEIWPTSNVFKAGHKIRINISNTDFPHLLPSLVPSQSKVLHDSAHPSRLIIPVIPKGSTADRQWINDIDNYLSEFPEWVAGLDS